MVLSVISGQLHYIFKAIRESQFRNRKSQEENFLKSLVSCGESKIFSSLSKCKFYFLGTGYKCVSPADLKDYQADLIIDCSGAAPAIEKAVDLLAPGGKLCIFGVASPQARVR